MKILCRRPAWIHKFSVWISLRKYFVLLVLHIIPTTLVLYFSCILLSSKGHQSEGLIKIVFDVKLPRRGLPISIPQSIPDTIPQDLPDTVSQIGSKVTGLGNLIPSQINSAIASVETAVGQVFQSIPTGYSVGTTSACIEDDSGTKCRNFPIKSSDLPEIFLRILSFSRPLNSLINFLDDIHSLEVILILGLTFNIVSTVTYALVYWLPKLRYISFGLSIFSLICLAMFTYFTQKIMNFGAKIGQIGTVQRGNTYYGLIGSIPHFLISFTCVFVKTITVRMPENA